MTAGSDRGGARIARSRQQAALPPREQWRRAYTKPRRLAPLLAVVGASTIASGAASFQEREREGDSLRFVGWDAYLLFGGEFGGLRFALDLDDDLLVGVSVCDGARYLLVYDSRSADPTWGC